MTIILILIIHDALGLKNEAQLPATVGPPWLASISVYALWPIKQWAPRGAQPAGMEFILKREICIGCANIPGQVYVAF